jgi:hypothetical protein
MACIGALDTPQRPKSIDLGDEFAKIFVRHVCNLKLRNVSLPPIEGVLILSRVQWLLLA